ncbi:unnamed protein product [Cutaneotrichosporon oleaginosum]
MVSPSGPLISAGCSYSSSVLVLWPSSVFPSPPARYSASVLFSPADLCFLCHPPLHVVPRSPSTRVLGTMLPLIPYPFFPFHPPASDALCLPLFSHLRSRHMPWDADSPSDLSAGWLPGALPSQRQEPPPGAGADASL